MFLVNVLKGKTWNEESEFDASKDKTQFRQYEDACDRVKNFYKEQHGMSIITTYTTSLALTDVIVYCRKTDYGVQYQGPRPVQNTETCSHERMGGHGDA